MLKQLSLLSLVVVSSIAADYLNVPSSLRTRAIFYKRSKQLRIFSCGYNVLFNAANFEHHCGFTNDAYKYDIFEKKVLSYLKTSGHDPQDSSYNDMTEVLASSVLKLQPFYHLRKDRCGNGAIRLSMTRKTTGTYPQILTNGRWNEDAVFAGILRYVEKHTYAVVHFLCYVQGRSGNHGILVSLFQNESGRALYIFDNLNDAIYESDDITKFLTFLCITFSVSSMDEFENIQLPTWWPHLDRWPRGRR